MYRYRNIACELAYCASSHMHISIGCTAYAPLVNQHLHRIEKFDAEDCHIGLARLAILVSPKMFSRFQEGA